MSSPIKLAELPKLPSILIRISREWRAGLNEAQLYERVRRYWRVRPDKRRTPPVLAYGIADGAIQAVYWVDGWETYDMSTVEKDADRLDASPHAAGVRYGFWGRPAGEFEHLIGQILLDPPKGQNPISYLSS